VAWLGYNSPELLALLFACARLGAMFMPLNWRLAAPEHKQMLEDCPPAVLFVEPDFVDQTDIHPCPHSAICAASSMGRPHAPAGSRGMPFLAAVTAAAPRAAKSIRRRPS
jgi:acyl-CoA synthetase (AMP-forming)/AMP-acid ligase II